MKYLNILLFLLNIYVKTTISFFAQLHSVYSKLSAQSLTNYNNRIHQKIVCSECRTLNVFSFKKFAIKPNKVDLLYDDIISDEDWNLVAELALNEDHVKELSLKVENAVQEEWDYKQGVTSQIRSPNPSVKLKANIDLWSYNAKQQLRNGNFSGATQWYKRCVEYNPRDGRPWLGLAQLEWKKNNPELAEKYYKEGIQNNPKNSYLLQGYAVLLEKIGKTDLALELLTKSVKYDPKHSASWVALARLHQRSSRFEEAQFCFSSAIENNPKSYVAYQAWGVLESELGHYDHARELFKMALSHSPESAHAYQAWATLEKKLGRLDEAIHLLNTSLSYFPQNTRTRECYAEILELQGYIKETRELFLSGESYATRSGDAGFFQSWALFENRQIQSKLFSRRKRYAPFINNHNVSTTIAPISSFIHSTNESDNMNRREIDPAISFSLVDYLNTSTKSSSQSSSLLSSDSLLSDLSNRPSSGRHEWNMTEAIWLENQYASVRRLFKKAITVNKYHSASWVAWSKFEQGLGNIEVARKLLVAGISKFPHSKNIAWFHCALGNLAWKEGDMNTARACYSRALANTPSHKSLSVLLEYACMESDTYSIVNSQKSPSTFSSETTVDKIVESSSTSSNEITNDNYQHPFSSGSKIRRQKEVAIAQSVKEARKLFELAVKRFPKEKRAWDAYFDFESRQSLIGSDKRGVGTISTMSGIGGSDRLKDLSERRRLALTSSSVKINVKDDINSSNSDDEYAF